MGSLFKLRDLWSFKSNEEFAGHTALVVANVDNEKSGAVKIVTGSFQGTLRIFDVKNKSFKPEDIVFERNFREPILAIAAGKFLPTSKVSLALLFPRRLVIASLVRSDAAAKQQQQQQPAAESAASSSNIEQPTNFFYQLTTHVEHRFEHTAYNFTFGGFGNNTASEQELICVQSMDGQLSFLDHNKILFQRYLPSSHFLTPGAIAYIPKMDAVLIGSSSFELHCFRYKSLTQSTASETKDSGTGEGSSGSGDSGRRVSSEWACTIGEDILQIEPCRFHQGLQNSQVDLVVLCERTLFVLKESGEMKFQKRLDVPSMCCATYWMPEGKLHNLLVGTHTSHVVVHSEAAIVWNAKAPATPLALRVASLCGTAGMIVALLDNGTVSVNYLGTDPAANPVQVLESKDLDYEAIDEEHRRLQGLIRQAIGSNRRLEPSTDVLQIRLDPLETTLTAQQRKAVIPVVITNTATSPVQNATLIIHTTEPLKAEENIVSIGEVGPKQTLRMLVTILPQVDADCIIPTSLHVDIALSYTAPSGENLTARTFTQLPLAMVATPVPPLKNIAFKVQIDTNKAPPPSLADVFSDLNDLGGGNAVAPNVLSIQYCNGSDATVLVSKNAGRYRIQSSSFEGLWLMVADLVRRLRMYYRGDEGSAEPLRLDAPDGLPLEEFLGMVDVHCAMRTELATGQQRLANEAQQFRAIQKRLLVRYRDRNHPTPLASLEHLFQDTYRRLHVSSEEVEQATSRLRQACAMLSSSTHLLLLMLHIRCQDTLTKSDLEILRHYITPNVPFNPSSGSLGWEETVDANLTHLLRTALSRNSKESSTSPQPLVASADGTKVKKHLTIVLDRLCKGATLVNPQMAGVEVAEPSGNRGIAQQQ
jgi:Bardet-Biedl syndrome 9 protein